MGWAQASDQGRGLRFAGLLALKRKTFGIEKIVSTDSAEAVGSFRKLGVPCFGVLIIRILYYIRVPHFRKLPVVLIQTICH